MKTKEIKEDLTKVFKDISKIAINMLPYEDESGIIEIPLHSFFNINETILRLDKAMKHMSNQDETIESLRALLKQAAQDVLEERK